jgi:DNA-binding CsgD family transcriptional regulator
MSIGLIALTARECEVMQLMLQSHTNRQIAGVLGIAEHTVEKHLGKVFRKLGVTNRTSAALKFLAMSQQPVIDHTGNPS